MEEQKKKPPSGKPAAVVFRKKLTVMVDLLCTSRVMLPGLLAKHKIPLDDVTRDKAITLRSDANDTVKTMSIIKTKVTECPGDNFKKFIDCLNDVDSSFFGRTIEKLGQCS